MCTQLSLILTICKLILSLNQSLYASVLNYLLVTLQLSTHKPICKQAVARGIEAEAGDESGEGSGLEVGESGRQRGRGDRGRNRGRRLGAGQVAVVRGNQLVQVAM